MMLHLVSAYKFLFTCEPADTCRFFDSWTWCCHVFQEVVRTVIQEGGVKHLVTMATSEHMIMQNEALVALGLIAALDLSKTRDIL